VGETHRTRSLLPPIVVVVVVVVVDRAIERSHRPHDHAGSAGVNIIVKKVNAGYETTHGLM